MDYSNSNSNRSPISDFLLAVRYFRDFNQNNTNKITKNIGNSIIFLIMILNNTNISDYIKLIALLTINRQQNKEIKDFKNNTIDPCQFSKFQSIQPFVAYIFDIDTSNLQKKDPRIGVFTRALEDRGVDSLGNNLKKREYYSAFNLKTIPYYDTHINDLLNSLHADSIKNTPLLSSFSKHLVTYFLNIHLGIPTKNQTQRPQVVIDYFNDILKVIALRPGRENRSIFDIKLSNIAFVVSINKRAQKVKDYFKIRIEEIKKETPMNKSIAVTNWLTSGFDSDSVQIAAFHNIVAFSQFMNTLFIICDNFIKNPDDNYLSRYKNAKSQKEVNILIFDIFKYEVPNRGSLSRDTKNNEIVRHLHKDTMINVDPNNKLYKKNIKNFGDSNLSSNKCPFHNSPADNETVIPCGADNLIPVFDKPLYTPFGLGYRRCAGELLSYRFTDYLLNFLTNYKISQDLDITDDIAVGPATRVSDNLFIRKI